MGQASATGVRERERERESARGKISKNKINQLGSARLHLALGVVNALPLLLLLLLLLLGKKAACSLQNPLDRLLACVTFLSANNCIVLRERERMRISLRPRPYLTSVALIRLNVSQAATGLRLCLLETLLLLSLSLLCYYYYYYFILRNKNRIQVIHCGLLGFAVRRANWCNCVLAAAPFPAQALCYVDD